MVPEETGDREIGVREMVPAVVEVRKIWRPDQVSSRGGFP